MKQLETATTSIPALGFATRDLQGSSVEQMVETAIQLGYRYLDTAQMDGNEAEIGRAIAASGIPREQIFLATKVAHDRVSRDQLLASVDASLEQLRTDYVDLLLLHWPNPSVPMEETILALAEAAQAGKARHIGVANYTPGHLDQALSIQSDLPLTAVQVEYHPFLDQSPLLTIVRQHELALLAHTPLALGTCLRNQFLAEIGENYGKSAAQVALRWLIQQPQVGALAPAADREHAEEYFDIFDFELTDQDMQKIHALARPDGRMVNPARLAPDWGSQEGANVPEDPDREMASRI